MSSTSTIKQVDSEFDDIYRITTENGLILDIFQNNKPIIGSIILYYILHEKDYINHSEYINSSEYTIMNGNIFNISAASILVSFGGLLGDIPFTDKTNLTENITLIYKITEN